MMLSFLFLPFALGNGKRKRCILFPFLRKRKEDGWHSLVSALEKFLSGRDEDVFLRRGRREEKKGDLSFFFSVFRRKKKRNAVPFLEEEKKKNGKKKKRERASSLIPAFDTLSAAACDEEAVLLVCTVVDIVSEKHLISFFHDDGKSIINQKSTFLYPRFPRSSSLLIFS